MGAISRPWIYALVGTVVTHVSLCSVPLTLNLTSVMTIKTQCRYSMNIIRKTESHHRHWKNLGIKDYKYTCYLHTLSLDCFGTTYTKFLVGPTPIPIINSTSSTNSNRLAPALSKPTHYQVPSALSPSVSHHQQNSAFKRHQQ